MNVIWKIKRSLGILKILKNQYVGLAGIPYLDDLAILLKKYDSTTLELQDSRTLDIGCGESPRNPFSALTVYGIDIRENASATIKTADLTVEGIPFPDDFFDYITAHDFLEHVPRIVYLPNRRFAFVELMNEIWRTLKPGGVFLSRTPVYPFSQVFQDPTHVNIITHETFPRYFDDNYKWASMYGFNGSFEILSQSISEYCLISVMKKVS